MRAARAQTAAQRAEVPCVLWANLATAHTVSPVDGATRATGGVSERSCGRECIANECVVQRYENTPNCQPGPVQRSQMAGRAVVVVAAAVFVSAHINSQLSIRLHASVRLCFVRCHSAYVHTHTHTHRTNDFFPCNLLSFYFSIGDLFCRHTHTHIF